MTVLFLCGLMLLLSQMTASAEESQTDSYVDGFLGQLDYTEVDELLQEHEETKDISFGDMLSDLLLSEEGLTLSGFLGIVGKKAMEGLFGELWFFGQLLLIVAVSALLSTFSRAFSNPQVAKMGSYVAFMLLFGVLAQAYLEAASVAATTLSYLVSFMKMLVPIYLACITFCVGITSVTAFYQIYLMLITLAQNIMHAVLLPLCNIYLLLAVSNHLPMEGSLSGFSSLIKRVIVWGRKSILVLTTGFAAINGLLTPGVDKLKQSTVVNALSAIPGLGGLFSGATQTVLGAGVVVKNTVGAAGVVILVVLCVRPLIKLFFFQLLFRIVAAVASIIADKGMVSCLEAAADAVQLLFDIVWTAVLAFALVLVIACVTTS